MGHPRARTAPDRPRLFRPVGRIGRALARMIFIALCLTLPGSPRRSSLPDDLAQADALRRAGQYGQAIPAYQQLLQVQPGDPALLMRLLQTSAAARRYDLAAVYLNALAADGWTPELYSEQARLAEAERDPLAAAYWTASLTGGPGDAPTLRILAEAALTERDWTRAIEYYQQAVALDAQDMRAVYRLGLLLAPSEPRIAEPLLLRALQDARYAVGAQAVRAVFVDYGGEAPASFAFRVGLALVNRGEWPFVERALTLALARGSVIPQALAFLGLAQDQQGRDGWPAISKALESAPADALVNYAAGVHWRLKGDTQQALGVLKFAWSADSQNPAIAAEMGMVYRTGRALPEAAQWLRLAVLLAPNEPGFRVLLTNFYADESFDLAGDGMATIRSAAEILPDNADVAASLGWALLSTDQAEAAQPILEKAIRLDAANMRARYYFAVALEYRGDKAGAGESYARVFRETTDAGLRERAQRGLERLGYRQ